MAPLEPPFPGWIQDRKTRGWYDPDYGSYQNAPNDARMSRRQYDETIGRLAETGLSYEAAARQAREAREREEAERLEREREEAERARERVDISEEMESGPYTFIYVSFGGDIAQIAQGLELVPPDRIFMVQAYGVPYPPGKRKSPKAQGKNEPEDEDEGEEEEQEPIWLNVLPSWNSNSIRSNLDDVINEINEGVIRSFPEMPEVFSIMWKERTTRERGRR